MVKEMADYLVFKMAVEEVERLRAVDIKGLPPQIGLYHMRLTAAATARVEALGNLSDKK